MATGMKRRLHLGESRNEKLHKFPRNLQKKIIKSSTWRIELNKSKCFSVQLEISQNFEIKNKKY